MVRLFLKTSENQIYSSNNNMFPNHPNFLPIVNLHSIFHPPLSNPTNNRPFHNVVSHQTSKKTTKPSLNSKPKNLSSNFQFKHFSRYQFQATLFPNRSCHFVFLQKTKLHDISALHRSTDQFSIRRC